MSAVDTLTVKLAKQKVSAHLRKTRSGKVTAVASYTRAVTTASVGKVLKEAGVPRGEIGTSGRISGMSVALPGFRLSKEKDRVYDEQGNMEMETYRVRSKTGWKEKTRAKYGPTGRVIVEISGGTSFQSSHERQQEYIDKAKAAFKQQGWQVEDRGGWMAVSDPKKGRKP